MNSLQKNTLAQAKTQDDYIESFLKNLGSMNEYSDVELLLKKLQYLGLNFDPFSGDKTIECEQVMDQLGITLHLQNPFQATNLLLRLLDKTEERLKTLQQ